MLATLTVRLLWEYGAIPNSMDAAIDFRKWKLPWL